MKIQILRFLQMPLLILWLKLLLPTGKERALAEMQRADTEKQRADAEKQRADEAQREIERLREKLKLFENE